MIERNKVTDGGSDLWLAGLEFSLSMRQVGPLLLRLSNNSLVLSKPAAIKKVLLLLSSKRKRNTIIMKIALKLGFTSKDLCRPGGGALQLRLYGGVWPQDRKIDPSAD